MSERYDVGQETEPGVDNTYYASKMIQRTSLKLVGFLLKQNPKKIEYGRPVEPHILAGL